MATTVAAPPVRHGRSGIALALGLQLGSAAVALAGLAAVVQLAFPVLAVALGVRLLVQRRAAAYLEYVIWLWLLISLVRRTVDLGVGWTPVSPVMFAAPAATVLCLLPALRGPRRLEPVIGGALLVALIGLTYGCAVGALTSGPIVAVGALATWLPPLAVGLYVATAGPAYEDLLAVLRRSAVLGCVVLGAYGIVQFFVMPPWDAFWMQNAPINSIGYPYPFEVRVFSTLNSPAPFAVVMSTLLVLLTGVSVRLRWLAALVGVLSLGLSLVRTAWLGYAVSLVALFSPRRGHLLRAGLLAVVLPLLVVAFVGGPARDALVDRFADTAGAGQADTSFSERVRFHAETLPVVVSDPFGTGLGAVGVATKLGDQRGQLAENADFDGGALELLFTYGIAVGLAVLVTTVLGVRAAWNRAKTRSDLERAMAAALVGLVVQLLLYQPLLTPTGVLFYLLLATLSRAPGDDRDDRGRDTRAASSTEQALRRA